MKSRRCYAWISAGLVAGVVLFGGIVAFLNVRGEAPISANTEAFQASQEQIQRGRYLALAGNCASCHTTRGGTPYAGGRGIETPFGNIYAGNLTPDPETGIGQWSADHFWRALHNGRSKDGRLLYPAFPYVNYTNVSREDSDAIYAWLRTLEPVAQENRPHELEFPYNTQAALAVWRALYFKPGTYEPQSHQSEEWNRGSYLVKGLGHCIACHGSRNALGATDFSRGLAGSMLPDEKWYAPALNTKTEGGVADWPTHEIIQLLKTGVTPQAGVSGPMADIVYESTQHLNDQDLTAIATYLKAIPEQPKPNPSPPVLTDASAMVRGEAIYAQQCASCHGEKGQGSSDAFPPLAGNRAVTLENPANLIQMVRQGGFLPATAGNPRPYGMPPFGHVLSHAEIAAVLTYIRGSWGNNASEVRTSQIRRH